MYHCIGLVRADKSHIRHRVFSTRLKEGCAAEYKRRHDALIEARHGVPSPGPDSNFTIWNANGYIFGYDEIDTAYRPDPSLPQKTPEEENSISAWVKQIEGSCYICNRFADTYDRYMDTFFYMYKRDEEFRKKIKEGKGFCLHHFGDLCEAGETRLSDKEKKEFYDDMFALMERNMERLQEDVNWLVEKFDYRNKDADWKNSRDAVQRGMQKLKGGYPGDPVYKMNK